MNMHPLMVEMLEMVQNMHGNIYDDESGYRFSYPLRSGDHIHIQSFRHQLPPPQNKKTLDSEENRTKGYRCKVTETPNYITI